jgi:hypothetical protein
MGAWDVTAFGNDDAADWAAGLVDADKPTEFLKRTFALAEGNGYLEAPNGSQLVAAAAIVAAALSGRAPQSFPEDAGWLHGKADSFRGLAAAAAAGIERVRGDNSELRDLWQETEEFSAWEADLEAILAGLR